MIRKPELRARKMQNIREKPQRTIEPKSAKDTRKENRIFTRRS